MRIENTRSWLEIETSRFELIVIWPFSPSVSTFQSSGDPRFGCTDEGDGETWFYLGRVFAILARKSKRPALGETLADYGDAVGRLEAA